MLNLYNGKLYYQNIYRSRYMSVFDLCLLVQRLNYGFWVVMEIQKRELTEFFPENNGILLVWLEHLRVPQVKMLSV